jgi:hypothetical protein
VDSLRGPTGRDDHAALDSVLHRAARRGGAPVVQLSGTFTDASRGLWVPDGVTVRGRATIRFTRRDLQYGALNASRHVTVANLTLVGPWERQDWDPHAAKHPGLNGGGNPEHHGGDIEFRNVTVRGFSGAGYNSGEYVDDVRILNSRFLSNGDAGVQIGPEVVGFRITGTRSEGNRNNGFDINGSRGYLAYDTAIGNGRAVVSYPDGSSDVSGFLVWAVTDAHGRHDAVGNVIEHSVALRNYGKGFSINGGATSAVIGTVLSHDSAAHNGSVAFHVMGQTGLDGLGDNRGTTLEACSGDAMYVQHLGAARRAAVYRLRVRGNRFGRQLIDEPEGVQ